MKENYHYDDHTWPELKERVDDQPVVLLPVGSVEDHGHHLPLKTDNFFTTTLCERVAERIAEEVLVMPLIPYGFNYHHSADFPGTIHVEGQPFIEYVLGVTKSVAYHGFEKILIVDGHGSNMPFLDIVARRTVMETDAVCGAFIYMHLIKDLLTELRETEMKEGGMAHAGEFETSLYLYLDKGTVQKEKMKRDMDLPDSDFTWIDLESGGPVKLMDWWSTFSETGVLGDPTVASSEKGEKWFEALLDQMVKLVREFKQREIRSRRNHH